jgi:beta-carotene 3-hydroxylase
MEIVFYFLTVIATFFFMEFMAWFTFIMHGIMWYFHKDHHQHEPGFEKTTFFLIFAIQVGYV